MAHYEIVTKIGAETQHTLIKRRIDAAQLAFERTVYDCLGWLAWRDTPQGRRIMAQAQRGIEVKFGPYTIYLAQCYPSAPKRQTPRETLENAIFKRFDTTIP